MGELFDIVQVQDKSPEELILGFDLPVCRVAHNFAMDFWISAQALAAMETRRQNVPLYLKEQHTFMDILNKHITYTNKSGEHIHEAFYHRFIDRVKKYQSRGYGVNWVETDVIIPWIKKRFHYGEWDITNTPESTPEQLNPETISVLEGKVKLTTIEPVLK